MSLFWSKKTATPPIPANAGASGATQLEGHEKHFVSGAALRGPYPKTSEQIFFGMGCFWGAERLFWPLKGVLVTAVGYQGGTIENATYEEVCSGRTGHTEAVMVVFDPKHVTLTDLLTVFWEEHDPTQGNRQGADQGTQYRSAIYTVSEIQALEAETSRGVYQTELSQRGLGKITTEIDHAKPFYFAENYHQQYLAKNPGGYCGLKGTGVACPIKTT